MIWDLPLRLFHWSMVGVVTVAGVTGFLAPDSWLDIHIKAGYALGGLLVFRLTWGFFGSHFSKFRSFPLSGKGVVTHLFQVIRNKPLEYLGHNPVGALMIVVLLVSLALLVITGLVVAGGQEKMGPLAFLTSYRVGHFAEDIHEAAAWVVVWAVVVHVFGVVVETRIFHHPVILAMITGRKATTLKGPTREGWLKLTGGLILSLGVTAAIVAGGAALAKKSPSGWRSLAYPKVYSSECGDCHDAYHPSLRSAAAWQAIMTGLSDHYGEDASLGKNATDSIGAFLEANHAGTFDTEVAHRIGRKDTASLRLTDTRRWKKWHREVDDSVFRLRVVGSKVNCTACHTDALSGRFDDAKIHLPTGDKK